MKRRITQALAALLVLAALALSNLTATSALADAEVPRPLLTVSSH
jgi:hypothetical protein